MAFVTLGIGPLFVWSAARCAFARSEASDQAAWTIASSSSRVAARDCVGDKGIAPIRALGAEADDRNRPGGVVPSRRGPRPATLRGSGSRRNHTPWQHGRSHGGQVIVITQSAADIAPLTKQPGLLASLTDNFAGVVAHPQTSPESRDWLANLMGTRALWQTTNQTTGHGSQHSGSGSARRVREFKIGADVFSGLRRGEAVIYTSIAGEPTAGQNEAMPLSERPPERIDPAGARHRCEVPVHPELTFPDQQSSTPPGAADEHLRPRDAENPFKM
jgi:hypothetical protein